jgi:short-subunit dehydrogenase
MTSAAPSGRPRALVTGASAGIGAIFAERLAGQGYDLAILARRRDRLEELAERLRRERGVNVEVICADLANADDVKTTEAIIANDESLALLVNNAGFGGYSPFAAIDPNVIDALVGVHIQAVARLTRAALPGMIQRGAGGVINIASLLALSGSLPPSPLPYRAIYAGAKAFLVAFTQTLAGELKGSGVKVQVCLPGRVSTEFHTVQGLDVSRLPPAMKAEDVVTASLAALSRDELVCIPGLAEPGLFDQVTEAQRAVLAAAGPRPNLAERYQPAAS